MENTENVVAAVDQEVKTVEEHVGAAFEPVAVESKAIEEKVKEEVAAVEAEPSKVEAEVKTEVAALEVAAAKVEAEVKSDDQSIREKVLEFLTAAGWKAENDIVKTAEQVEQEVTRVDQAVEEIVKTVERAPFPKSVIDYFRSHGGHPQMPHQKVVINGQEYYGDAMTQEWKDPNQK